MNKEHTFKGEKRPQKEIDSIISSCKYQTLSQIVYLML